MLRRQIRVLFGCCALALVMGVSSCGTDAKQIATRDAALAKLQTPIRLNCLNAANDGYIDSTLSAADSAELMAALRDSQPIEWQLKSRIQYNLNGGQPVQIGVMEQNVFKVMVQDDPESGGYYQSNQDLLGLLQKIRATVGSADLPQHP